jgi:hypothetical protein
MRNLSNPGLLIAASLCGSLLLGACGGDTEQPTSAVTTVTVTQAPPIIEPPTSTATTFVDPQGDGSTSATDAPSLTVDKPLGLSSFFQPISDWTENRYNVADREEVQGIASVVNWCYPTEHPLELRLENKFQSLQFEVGQANTSEGSSQILIVDVAANGSQADIRRVAFNEIQNFTIPASGVNAMTIDFYLDNEADNCGDDSVTAILLNAVLS